MFLSDEKIVVATVTNESGRYVKLTIDDTVDAIANLIISAEGYIIKVFDRFQDEFLIECLHEDIFANEENVTDAEKKITEIIEKVKDIENGKGERTLKVYNFWFTDEYNNLEVLREAAKQAGFKIDSSTWIDCV